MNRSSATADIQVYLIERQAAMINLLSELVAIESPSDNAVAQQPILQRLKSEFEELNYKVRIIPGQRSGGHLYGRSVTRAAMTKLQLLLGHCDTVWPIGTLATMPLQTKDGMMRGPGIYDMKAGLVEMIFALKALKELKLQPEVSPIIFINSDEEIGSRESTRYIKRLAQLVDRALVLEPSLGPTGKIKTTRKGVGRFTIKVKGKAAHAGLDPNAGASAILELSHLIQKLFALNNPDQGVSVNVGVIDGGTRANVIAPESSAVIDVRVETQSDGLRVENAIRALQPEDTNVTLKIEGGIGRPPMERTEANQQLWMLATDLASSLGIHLEQGTAGGGSDGNTTSLYTATLDGLGAVGDGAHAAHEFIYTDQLPERCALLTTMLLAPPLCIQKE